MVGGDASPIRIARLSVLGALLVAYGAWLRKKCYRELGKHFTFKLTIRKDHKLVTTGPYATVRHPSYNASLSVIIGTICFYISRGSWLTESGILGTKMYRMLICGSIAMVSFLVVLVKRRWEAEDEVLKKEFGEQWVEWTQRVPYAVLPGIL
jgi:protein-S-isoprenylcysteine O-methyltransferase Ste14